MNNVKIYTVVSDELSPPVAGEGFCVDMVRHSDFAELEAKLLDMAVQLANRDSQIAELAAENAGLKSVLEEIINADEPEYHEQGMGCGVEDRGYQRDGYSACSYGWYSAIDRIYSEVIPGALPETPATDAYLAEVRAEVIEWLDAEISAIDPVYRGDPSYEHDAYWMKTEVQDLIESARKIFAAKEAQ